MDSRPATTLRRSGLPRVSGGAAWPPRAASALLAESASATVPAGLGTNVLEAEPAASSVAFSAATSGATHAIRRGLPRVTDAAARAAGIATGLASGSVPAAGAGAGPTAGPATGLASGLAGAGSVPVQAPGQETRTAPTLPPAELGAGTVLQRRGLPRTVGGESWPPERAVPVVAAVPVPLVAPLAPVVNAAPEVPEANEVPAAVAVPILRPTDGSAEIPVRAPSPRPERRRYRGRTLPQWAGVGVLAGAALFVVGALAMLLVRWLLGTEPLQNFLTDYPGEYELPEGAPVGLPWWLSWAHFFNVFLILLIIRSGLQTRAETRPTVFWTPKWNPGRKISLTIWFHQALDLLWFLNGVVFVVLLLATGQWVRIVPTSWAVFPNALSAGLQYLSLDWPTENGWVNYNGLQQLAYFGTVFLAAPLAAATGVRMSGLWPKGATRLNKFYPIEVARAVHFPVMLYFVVFIAFHITLVLATGALRNLNHMYAGQDVVNWTGLGIFAVSLLVIAGGVFAARPLVIAPIAALFGRVGR